MQYAEALSAKAGAMSSRGKKPVLRSVEIEKAENGGHTVTHRFQNSDGPYHEAKPYVFGASEGNKLVAHLKEHMGIGAETGGAKKAVSMQEEDEHEGE